MFPVLPFGDEFPPRILIPEVVMVCSQSCYLCLTQSCYLCLMPDIRRTYQASICGTTLACAGKPVATLTFVRIDRELIDQLEPAESSLLHHSTPPLNKSIRTLVSPFSAI